MYTFKEKTTYSAKKYNQGNKIGVFGLKTFEFVRIYKI